MNSIKYSFLRKKQFSQKNVGYVGTYETEISGKFMKFGIIYNKIKRLLKRIVVFKKIEIFIMNSQIEEMMTFGNPAFKYRGYLWGMKKFLYLIGVQEYVNFHSFTSNIVDDIEFI